MKIAVVSDLHAKAERVEAVFDDVRKASPDQIWCLGDIVGYGKDVERVVRIARKCDLVIAGNHDHAATGQADWFLEGIPDWLKGSLLRVKRDLSEEDFTWLKSLKPSSRSHAINLYHGSVQDPLFGVLDSEERAWWHLMAQESRTSLVGHSHRPLAVGLQGEKKLGVFEPSHGDQIELAQADRWVLNPGTAGLNQTEGTLDRRSGWMLLDTDKHTATWYRLQR